MYAYTCIFTIMDTEYKNFSDYFSTLKLERHHDSSKLYDSMLLNHDKNLDGVYASDSSNSFSTSDIKCVNNTYYIDIHLSRCSDLISGIYCLNARIYLMINGKISTKELTKQDMVIMLASRITPILIRLVFDKKFIRKNTGRIHYYFDRYVISKYETKLHIKNCKWFASNVLYKDNIATLVK